LIYLCITENIYRNTELTLRTTLSYLGIYQRIKIKSMDRYNKWVIRKEKNLTIAERAERALAHTLPSMALLIFRQIVESETNTGRDQKGQLKSHLEFPVSKENIHLYSENRFPLLMYRKSDFPH